MKIKIRSLNKKDIPDCLKIISETKVSSNLKEARKIMDFSLAPGIKPLNPNYYVLELDKKIIGISGLYYDYEDPKDIMWMDYFAVSPALQRQGWGKKMLQNLEGICKKRKTRILCVFAETKQALSFYKKHKFKIFGRLNNYYGKNRHRIWLYKKV